MYLCRKTTLTTSPHIVVRSRLYLPSMGTAFPPLCCLYTVGILFVGVLIIRPHYLESKIGPLMFGNSRLPHTARPCVELPGHRCDIHPLQGGKRLREGFGGMFSVLLSRGMGNGGCIHYKESCSVVDDTGATVHPPSPAKYQVYCSEAQG